MLALSQAYLLCVELEAQASTQCDEAEALLLGRPIDSWTETLTERAETNRKYLTNLQVDLERAKTAFDMGDDVFGLKHAELNAFHLQLAKEAQFEEQLKKGSTFEQALARRYTDTQGHFRNLLEQITRLNADLRKKSK